MQRGHRRRTGTAVVLATVAALWAVAGVAGAATHDETDSALRALNETEPTGRDEKAIRYVENANGQLDEWTHRLIARLSRGEGPRERDPLFDGRAELQVRKIEVTYAGYPENPALTDAFRTLAALHRARLDAVRAMADNGLDPDSFRRHDEAVQQLARGIRIWRKTQ